MDAVRGGDALFPNYFEEDLLLLLLDSFSTVRVCNFA